MKSLKTVLAAVGMMSIAASAYADGEEKELAEAPAPARWTVHAGYAWRSNVKTDFGGSSSARGFGGVYDNGSWNAADDKDWTTTSGFDQSRYDNPTVPGDKLNALALTRSDSACGGDEENCMHGVKFGVGYDFYSGDYLAVAALLDFAGYWGLENSTSGGFCRYTDYYAFNAGPTVGDGFLPESGVDSAEYVERQYLSGGASSTMRTKLRADLYQIGLGPQFTVHPFESWCETLSWIDIYANVKVLCNIIKSDLDAGAASTSETNCKVGFGGNLGLVGNITDWCGIYGQVGYEWVDKDEVSVRGISAETDYSSLILSAGIQFRF